MTHKSDKGNSRCFENKTKFRTTFVFVLDSNSSFHAVVDQKSLKMSFSIYAFVCNKEIDLHVVERPLPHSGVTESIKV